MLVLFLTTWFYIYLMIDWVGLVNLTAGLIIYQIIDNNILIINKITIDIL